MHESHPYDAAAHTRCVGDLSILLWLVVFIGACRLYFTVRFQVPECFRPRLSYDTCIMIASLPAASSTYYRVSSNLATAPAVLVTVRHQQQQAAVYYYARVADPRCTPSTTAADVVVFVVVFGIGLCTYLLAAVCDRNVLVRTDHPRIACTFVESSTAFGVGLCTYLLIAAVCDRHFLLRTDHPRIARTLVESINSTANRSYKHRVQKQKS